MNRALALLVVLMCSMGLFAGGRRRAVRHQTNPLEGVVMVQATGEPGPGQVFRIFGGIYDYLPDLVSKIGFRVTDSTGTVRVESESVIFCPGCSPSDFDNPKNRWIVTIWNGALTEGWPSGVSAAEMTVTRPGQQITVTARFSVNVTPVPQFGPLEKAIVDAAGGILLFGSFTTTPVVSDNQLFHVRVEEGYYIPPGVLYDQSGDTEIVVCAGVGGNSAALDCTTAPVRLPPTP